MGRRSICPSPARFRFTPGAALRITLPSPSARSREPLLIPRPSPFASLPARFLIAHRGVPARAPENGATGLALARDAGAPAVEIDVRPTRDGLLVVLHDETPRRLTGERAATAERTARELLEAPLAAEPAEHLLLLDEALALLAGRTLLDIEVKPDAGASPDDLAARVGAALARAGDPPSVVVTSESEEILAALARAVPQVPRGLVVRALDLRDPLAVAQRTGCSLLVPSARRVGERLVAAAREANLGVWAYTVNDAVARGGCSRSAATRSSPTTGLGCSARSSGPSAAGGRGRMAQRRTARGRPPGARPIVVLDLGSSSMKAAMVDPVAGVGRCRACRPRPRSRPRVGWSTTRPGRRRRH